MIISFNLQMEKISKQEPYYKPSEKLDWVWRVSIQFLSKVFGISKEFISNQINSVVVVVVKEEVDPLVQVHRALMDQDQILVQVDQAIPILEVTLHRLRLVKDTTDIR